MKKLLIGLLSTAIIAVAIVFAVKIITSNTNTSDTPTEEPVKPDLVQAQLDSMTLDQKIAQMLIVTSPSPTDSDQELPQLQTTPYGGYILMGDSFGTLAETRAMVEKYQSATKIPLIITTDQEGGLVQRLKNITDLQPTDIPDMYSVGETGDINYASTIGHVLAEELRTIGVNIDTAPDADVYSNPNNTVIGRRSFSSDPGVVATMSETLAKGLEDNGITATFKHFPGHGDTEVDSHENLPIINRTREQLDACDLIPFKNAIKNDAQLIMVGHIALPIVTGDNTPATLSHQITTDLLRNELGYDNLIITDALNMGALTNNYPETDIYTKTVAAGADLLLMPVTPSLAIETIKATIPESRIDESVYRILKFKQNYLADYQYLDFSYFGSPEHASAINR